MEPVYVIIYLGNSRHDKVLIRKDNVSRKKDPKDFKQTRTFYKTYIDSVLLHCLLKELFSCDNCRKDFVSCFKDINAIKLYSVPTRIDTIDYNWNEKVSILVGERCELDHALSWLSTLGGAFSALGDYFANMAVTAGKISMHQFQLALRLGDPTIASRCRLYFSLSLIQRQHFKIARRLIEHEYHTAMAANICDDRLIKMCLGIWSKLQYEWKLHRKR